MRLTAHIKILLFFLLLSLGAQAEPLTKIQINTKDDIPAKVFLENQLLGSTGSVLSVDLSKYRRPTLVDIVLQSEGFLPSLHTLEIPRDGTLWESPPLGLYKADRRVELRVEAPGAQVIKLEGKQGQARAIGTDSVIVLSPKNRIAPFAARSILLVLESPGYLPTRLEAEADIWSADVYPPPSASPWKLTKEPGLNGWWTRTAGERPWLLVFLLVGSLFGLSFGLARYHYLKKIEKANQALSRWLERMSIFADGTQQLAAPVDSKALAEGALLQARRLTWAADSFLFLEDTNKVHCGEQQVKVEPLSPWLDHLRDKGEVLRVDSIAHSKFPALGPEDRSVLAVALIFQSQFRGGIFCLKSTQEPFSEVDERALETFAFQLAGATERISLHREVTQAYQKLATSEAQLVQSAKMSAVGQLAAGVAHEINNPLGTISLGLELGEQLMEKSPAKAKKRLRLAKAAVDKAQNIVKKLLFYSREARVAKATFTAETLLQDVGEFLSFQLDQDEIDFQLVGDNSVSVTANLNETNQLVTSLVLNARDAILKHGAEAKIEVGARAQDEMVEIFVRDSGPGVEEGILDKIFDPFFTTKTMGEGTGLGLAVGRKIAQDHGGELDYRRLEGKTEFYLRLPRDVT